MNRTHGGLGHRDGFEVQQGVSHELGLEGGTEGIGMGDMNVDSTRVLAQALGGIQRYTVTQ